MWKTLVIKYLLNICNLYIKVTVTKCYFTKRRIYKMTYILFKYLYLLNKI